MPIVWMCRPRLPQEQLRPHDTLLDVLDVRVLALLPLRLAANLALVDLGYLPPLCSSYKIGIREPLDPPRWRLGQAKRASECGRQSELDGADAEVLDERADEEPDLLALGCDEQLLDFTGLDRNRAGAARNTMSATEARELERRDGGTLCGARVCGKWQRASDTREVRVS